MAQVVPNIRAVSPNGAWRVTVTWKGGAESEIDLGPFLRSYAVFGPLFDTPSRFAGVVVGEWGWCLHWSDDMEIAADTLWRLAGTQAGQWLKSWRERHGMDPATAARALGITPHRWRQFESGESLLPKTVRLAALGFDAQDRAA